MFTLDLRPETGVALHRQIYEQIRAAILSGRMRSHQKLPASRQLAQSLGVSRSTVTESYDQLISEGYLRTRKGAGTFVCSQIPETLLLSAPHNLQAGLQASQTSDDSLAYSLSEYAQSLKPLALPGPTSNCDFSFRYWRPDLSLFPTQQWQRITNRHSAQTTDWMTYSEQPMGHLRLREAIAAHITQVRAVRCQPEQILITQGTQQAVGLIAQLLLSAGEGVAVEDPGYLSARKIFVSQQAMLLPIAVDADGMQMEGPTGLLAQTAGKTVRLAYVTPSHQFPTGALMTLTRRLALLQWAQRHQALIIEDDYDSEFRYGGRPMPALQGLDNHGRVLYVGTFSKVMFPGLRLGYLVLPLPLVPVFARAKWLCDRQCSFLSQSALGEFIAEGHLSRHIRRMRLVYEKRRTVLMNSLREAFGDVGRVEFFGDAAGLHVMARLPLHSLGLSDQDFVNRAQNHGVDLFSVQRYYLPSNDFLPAMEDKKGLFIFGFGGMDEDAIEGAIARLKKIIESHLA